MHRNLIDILACPADKAPLTLTVEHADGDDVVSGSLTCTECSTAYLHPRLHPQPPPTRLPRLTSSRGLPNPPESVDLPIDSIGMSRILPIQVSTY